MLLTPWESESRLMGMFIATGCLEGRQALGVLLVGPWGQGKTEMIRRFSGLPTTRMVSDITSDGIRRVLNEDKAGTVRHFLMPEFDRVFSRDKSVSAQAVGLLCNLMTGDAGLEYIGRNVHDFTGRQVSIVGAMTTDVYRRRQEEIEDSGLASRFQIVSVDRDELERNRVIENILYQRNDDLTPIRWPQLAEMRRVLYDDAKLSRQVHSWLMATKGMPSNERFAARIPTLLRAIALLDGRSRVLPEDFATFRLFAPYFKGEHNVRIDWPFKGSRASGSLHQKPRSEKRAPSFRASDTAGAKVGKLRRFSDREIPTYRE